MKKFLLSTALLAIVGGLVVLGFLLFRDQQGPQISLTPAEGRISPRTVFKLTAKDTNSGVKALSVRVKKNSREFIALDQQWADKLVSRTEEFSLEKAEEMGEGTVELIVKATDSSFAAFGKGNTSTRSFTLRLDSQPPRISVTTLPPYVRRGGSACIAYTVNEDVRQTGVTVNDLFFPGYRQADGSYLCFFAFPFYEDTNTYAPRVTAEDEAGNVTSISLAVKPLHVAFKEDTIRLPDSFLDNKMQDFTDEFPGQMSSLERFLKVNRDLRKANRAALLSIGRKTSPAMLWSGGSSTCPTPATERDSPITAPTSTTVSRLTTSTIWDWTWPPSHGHPFLPPTTELLFLPTTWAFTDCALWWTTAGPADTVCPPFRNPRERRRHGTARRYSGTYRHYRHGRR